MKHGTIVKELQRLTNHHRWSQGLVVAWQHIKLMCTKLEWLEDELGICLCSYYKN